MEELDIQLKVFNENKEEDREELSHRLDDIHAEMEYPFGHSVARLGATALRREACLCLGRAYGGLKPALLSSFGGDLRIHFHNSSLES